MMTTQVNGIRSDTEKLVRRPGTKRIKVYVAEEQQLLSDAYQASFTAHPGIELVGISSDTAGDFLETVAGFLELDVVLLGTKILKPAAVELLERIREIRPDVGIVLLSAQCDGQGMKALREFCRRSTGGCAYLLKHTIDTADQLIEVINSVRQGRVILDPMVMEGLINGRDDRSSFLKELSPRELEVLSWMAKGYRNNTIAELLFLEPKTIERHINSVYTKINHNVESRHARVVAVMTYLKATGQLPVDELDND